MFYFIQSFSYLDFKIISFIIWCHFLVRCLNVWIFFVLTYDDWFCYYYIIFGKHHVCLWNFLWNLHYDFTYGQFLWLFHFDSEGYLLCLLWVWICTHSKLYTRGVCACVQSCPTLSNPIGCTLPSPSVVEFSRQECWRGLPFSTSRDVPDPGIEPDLSHLLYWQANPLQCATWEPLYTQYFGLIDCSIYIHLLVYFFQWTFIPHLIICWTLF